MPHSQHDGGFYTSLEVFTTCLGGEGYSGGVRLLKVSAPLLAFAFSPSVGLMHVSGCPSVMDKNSFTGEKGHECEGQHVYAQATCKRFLDACEQAQISLPQKNFTLSYETYIPRQAGLSGSSAIICAALNCLFDFYSVADRSDVFPAMSPS